MYWFEFKSNIIKFGRYAVFIIFFKQGRPFKMPGIACLYDQE